MKYEGFPCDSAGKESACNARSLGWKDPLEKGKATHSSILAWRIPWTTQTTGSQRVRHNWATFTFTFHWSVKVKLLSHVQLFGNPWTIAYQPPPSIGFSRQEYWNGLPFPSPGDLPNPGIDPGSLALQTDALPSEPPGKLYWRMVDLKYCVSLRCTAHWFSLNIFLFRFLSLTSYYKLLSRVPCTIQYILVGYLFYVLYCVYVNPSLLIYSLPTSFLLW